MLKLVFELLTRFYKFLVRRSLLDWPHQYLELFSIIRTLPMDLANDLRFFMLATVLRGQITRLIFWHQLKQRYATVWVLTINWFGSCSFYSTLALSWYSSHFRLQYLIYNLSANTTLIVQVYSFISCKFTIGTQFDLDLNNIN